MIKSKIKKVAVIGAGTMGQGIVHLTSLAGYPTLWYDVKDEILENGISNLTANLQKGLEIGKISKEEKQNALQNIEVTTNKNDLVADLIIEAVVEDLQIKSKLFEAIEKINDSTAIFATNTSSIPITSIASKLKHPERFIGLHFFNPAHIMKLVEIISGANTDHSVVVQIQEFANILGKTPVLANDSPGFIVNRVARHYYTESLKILEENVADIQTIDALLESTGFKMGPFRLMDLIGVDVNFAVTVSMYNSFHQDPKFRPNRIQEHKVLAGHHGKKSKKGFYDY
jgi:3-hydroxybutyryl-CoA dehydrogenase